MSNSLIEVCTLLIEDCYGEFFAHIFAALASHGRLIAQQLAQKCHLPLRQVLHGLVVLAQSHFVYHFTTPNGRSFYEACTRNSYCLLRNGKFVGFIGREYGEAAVPVVTQLLLQGQATIRDLKECGPNSDAIAIQSETYDEDTHGDPTESNHAHELEDGSGADQIVRSLCRRGLICRVRLASFRTRADNYEVAEDKALDSPTLSTSKGAKAKGELIAKTEAELEKQLDSRINTSKFDTQNRKSLKRKPEDSENAGPKSKRIKRANENLTIDSVVEDQALESDHNTFRDDLVVTINHARFSALLRNIRLVSMSSDIYGAKVSQTYEAVLRQLEYSLTFQDRSYRHDLDEETFEEVSNEVDEPRLAEDLAHPEKFGGKVAPTNGVVNGTKHHLTTEATTHLEILCQEPYNLLSRSEDRPDKFFVEYTGICGQLRVREIFRLALAKFDRHAVRILRVLHDKGKLDERNLQEIVLMSAKEVRQILANLQQAGFVELQEVPREAQRQPTRTMFLWFFDPEKARQNLVEKGYKCIARCLQRIQVERSRVKATVEKSERTDVEGQEEKLLSKAELDVLKQWRKKEEWLLAEIGRLDEMVLALRDF